MSQMGPAGPAGPTGISRSLPAEHWGKSLWTVFYSIVYTWPETATQIQINSGIHFFNSFTELFPCEDCKEEYKKIIRRTNLGLICKTRASMIKWMTSLSDQVNKRLGKPLFDHNAHFEYLDKIALKTKIELTADGLPVKKPCNCGKRRPAQPITATKPRAFAPRLVAKPPQQPQPQPPQQPQIPPKPVAPENPKMPATVRRPPARIPNRRMPQN